jgi:hypothetical protein
VLYDAKGDFDRNFDWWKESGKHRLVEPQLPFENGRSDLLVSSRRAASHVIPMAGGAVYVASATFTTGRGLPTGGLGGSVA